jgi:XTP/dITP diphosphohydrolase
MKFILASSNPHKAEELNQLLNTSGVEIVSASEKLEVVEDGATFEENAFKKASEYFEHYKECTVADDSGLVIPAMPGILGVQSARFAPDLPEYKDKCLKLIDLMKDLDDEQRKAYFTCVLCFYISSDEVYFFEGRVEGRIGYELKGDKGFGYDPVFYPAGQEGKSLAELYQWKMENSHRAKASIAAMKFFKGYKTGCQIQ